MIYQKRIQLTKLALALSIALAGAPALAQNTTSAVGGRITSADGRPAEAWTLVSPYPSRDLTRLESGTMLIVVDLQWPLSDESRRDLRDTYK